MNDEENPINEQERLAVLKEANEWMRHLDNVIWVVTSAFATLNILIIWKVLFVEDNIFITQIKGLLKIIYPLFIAASFYFLFGIGIITIKIVRLLNYNQLKIKCLREAIKIDVKLSSFKPQSLWGTLKLVGQAILKPWGVIIAVYIVISFFVLLKLWGKL